MVFCFVQNFFFGQHKSLNINFFCRAKREFFFQNLTLGCMTKTLNQIIFFFLHQNQNIFFSNIGNQNIFLEKNHNPPFKLNGHSLTYHINKNILIICLSQCYFWGKQTHVGERHEQVMFSRYVLGPVVQLDVKLTMVIFNHWLKI